MKNNKNKKVAKKLSLVADRGQSNTLVIGILAAVLIFAVTALVGIFLTTKNIINPSSNLTIPGQNGDTTDSANKNTPAAAIDSDNDGIPDEAEKIIGTDPNHADSKAAVKPTATSAPATNPNLDTDKDGIPDEAEKILGTNPAKADPKPATNPATAAATTSGATSGNTTASPTPKLDSDGDGVPDEVEKILGTDPFKK